MAGTYAVTVTNGRSEDLIRPISSERETEDLREGTLNLAGTSSPGSTSSTGSGGGELVGSTGSEATCDPVLRRIRVPWDTPAVSGPREVHLT